MNGWSVASKPEQEADGAGRAPGRASSTPRPWSPRHAVEQRRATASGASGHWAREIDSGRPDSRPSRGTAPNSSSTSLKSETTCSTPWPIAPSASAMPTSSSCLGGQRRGRLAAAAAVVERARRGEAEGAGLDRLARRARPSRRCRRAWPARGRRPRSPITYRRSAPWGTWAAKSMSWGCRRGRRGTRGNVSHSHERPSCRAVPGMSSTPSISSMRRSWSAGPHRREADAAVAHHDRGHAVPGRRGELGVPRGLAVVVGVDVDEARRDERAVGVDLPARRVPSTCADLGDHPVVDGHVGGAGRRRRSRRRPSRRG